MYASETYGITLYEASHPVHDGWVKTDDGCRKIQIKCTQGTRVGLGSRPEDCPDYLIVLYLDESGRFEEVYNGKGARVWDSIKGRKPQKTSQTQLSLKRLRVLDAMVGENERIRVGTMSIG